MAPTVLNTSAYGTVSTCGDTNNRPPVEALVSRRTADCGAAQYHAHIRFLSSPCLASTPCSRQMAICEQGLSEGWRFPSPRVSLWHARDLWYHGSRGVPSGSSFSSPRPGLGHGMEIRMCGAGGPAMVPGGFFLRIVASWFAVSWSCPRSCLRACGHRDSGGDSGSTPLFASAGHQTSRCRTSPGRGPWPS